MIYCEGIFFNIKVLMWLFDRYATTYSQATNPYYFFSYLVDQLLITNYIIFLNHHSFVLSMFFFSYSLDLL